ncbi:sporulation histidine kinase inhibitor Sda [Bacillus solitudinis]|nr:sporulation histidine kinase inhibitor Sda [Bacillus solitudinis]
MKSLSDEVLIESYYQATKLNLDETFIFLLKEELLKRGLVLSEDC